MAATDWRRAIDAARLPDSDFRPLGLCESADQLKIISALSQLEPIVALTLRPGAGLAGGTVVARVEVLRNSERFAGWDHRLDHEQNIARNWLAKEPVVLPLQQAAAAIVDSQREEGRRLAVLDAEQAERQKQAEIEAERQRVEGERRAAAERRLAPWRALPRLVRPLLARANAAPAGSVSRTILLAVAEALVEGDAPMPAELVPEVEQVMRRIGDRQAEQQGPRLVPAEPVHVPAPARNAPGPTTAAPPAGRTEYLGHYGSPAPIEGQPFAARLG